MATELSRATTDPVCFDGSPAPVRDDMVDAHRLVWRRISEPGTWWSGEERVALAAEVRAARECALCRERRQAVSPNAVQGEHESSAPARALLPSAAIDAIHRIVTDATRLTRTWYEQTTSTEISDVQYVELVGVVVAVTSIDFVCRGLGVPLHPLPAPVAGEPRRVRPSRAVQAEAWVPMIPSDGAVGAEADLWGGRTGNVIRAMSLVPDAVRDLKTLSAAHYLRMEDVVNPAAARALSRPQIELIAGRVSALNECFY